MFAERSNLRCALPLRLSCLRAAPPVCRLPMRRRPLKHADAFQYCDPLLFSLLLRITLPLTTGVAALLVCDGILAGSRLFCGVLDASNAVISSFSSSGAPCTSSTCPISSAMDAPPATMWLNCAPCSVPTTTTTTSTSTTTSVTCGSGLCFVVVRFFMIDELIEYSLTVHSFELKYESEAIDQLIALLCLINIAAERQLAPGSCLPCSPSSVVIANCSASADTQCLLLTTTATTPTTTTVRKSHNSSTTTPIIIVVVVLSTLLLVLLAVLRIKKRRKGNGAQRASMNSETIAQTRIDEAE